MCLRYNVYDMVTHYALYKTMLLIRRFEERLLIEFGTGKLTGTTHVCIGQEADAAGVLSAIDPEDVIFSNHRCHGHLLAYGGDPYHLAAELMGKSTGLVGGRGGSQHIQWHNFYSNGIQGGIMPIAAGMALAEKALQTGKIALAFIGDGTLGEGVLYESLNLASLWKLPLFVVLENNHYAQTTPVEISLAGSMAGRFTAFDIPVWELESSDVLEIHSIATKTVDFVRSSGGPGCLILHTYRFAAHSKGDDTRSPDELERIRVFDPLSIHGKRLTTEQRDDLEGEVRVIIDNAFNRAGSDPYPTLPPENMMENTDLLNPDS